jgi:membrane protein YdbS with pleckstrin-like domain
MPRLLKATYLAEGESLLRETRGTKLFYLPGPIAFILVFGFLTYTTAAAAYGWPNIAALNSVFDKASSALHGNYVLYLFALLLLIGFIWFLARYVRWVRTVYAVTNMRIIVQRGILSRDFDEIPVLQVRGVDVHQTFGNRILGYGTVRVSAEGGRVGGMGLGNEDWRGIPKPFEFQKVIENANQALLMRNVGLR